MKRVAVIGAGAAGLCALRNLIDRPHLYKPVAYELSAVVGGTWVYNENTGLDEHGQPIHSSMYKRLRTNLPKEIMAFPGFPFPKHLPSFCKHEDVRQYLEDYTDHYGLRDYIKFNTALESVEPVESNDGQVVWDVGVKQLTGSDKGVHFQQFDAIFVCNGHYSQPLIPEISGMDIFKGQVMHSHDYRVPEQFKGKTVLCLGAGSSGKDISLEISTCAKEVIISHNKPRIPSPLPSNVIESMGLERLEENCAKMKDGAKFDIDVLILCTGYKYSFPFLSPKCKVSVSNEERVMPLYKHILNAEFPTLAIIGVCKVILPFPHFDCQVKFALSSWEGDHILPSKEAMLEDIRSDYEWRVSKGMPARYAHHLSKLQWGYNDHICKLGKFPILDPVIHELYDYVHDTREKNLQNYKNLNYEVNKSTFHQL